jgi:hypothetical protein
MMMGMIMAKSAIMADPANSAVAMSGFPSPPVKSDDFILSAVVAPCITPAIPSPAMIAISTLRMGASRQLPTQWRLFLQ